MAMFADRAEAGFLLAEQLAQKEIPVEKSIVCGITRGGVVVASIIANILGVSLLPIPIKKIGLPEREELAIGAIAPGDIVYWDPKVVREFELTRSDLAVLLEETEEAYEVRYQLLKKYIKLSKVKNKTVILVDDGVATGATVKAAALSLKQQGAKNMLLAVPVIAEVVYNELLPVFTDIVALTIAEDFHSVGEFYSSFEQVSDEDVINVLKK